MSQINLHLSNRLDVLASALAGATAVPLPSPFTPEIVVVQSVATRRWLSFRLAELSGICANYAFPFLGEVIEELIAHASREVSVSQRPTADLLTWRIESALRRCGDRSEFAVVTRYLAGGDPLKRFALARRIAGLFDQYRVYRPELLLKWSSGAVDSRSGNEAWQAKLWLEIDGSAGFDQTLAALRRDGFSRADVEHIPARLSVFAPTAIAPAYLDLLVRLAAVREVHLFLLRPTAMYYGDSLTLKARAQLSGGDELVEDTGNPLLASWGKADLEFTNLLLETADRLGTSPHEASEDFRDIEPTDLLTTLQHQLFQASDESADPGAPKQLVASGDRSIVLNACHSPMREVEVLYDQLLDCFERFPELRPRDILVMTPEIEKYGPLIRAVFEYPEKETLRIPYSISDRHPRSESVVIDTFLTLLDLAGTRYSAPEIFLLLSSRILRQRFGLTDEDLSLIRGWIDETGIRWGIDTAHRAAENLPALAANTWRQGLERLLLGLAMESDQRELFSGILPADDVEGDRADTLGRFITSVEALFGIAANCAPARPLSAWADPLLELVTDFFEPTDDDVAQDVQHLRLVIQKLRVPAEAMLPQEAIEFRVVRQFLVDQVSAMEQRGSFLGEGVTFCALKPVRSIPAQVICLLGMNDQVFPRRPRLAEFDLMTSRCLGDPSAGADDRLAFLETVLSARHQLSISYIGRSVQDNQKIPPSVVISELFDYLDQAFAFPGGKSAEVFLLTEHPLQAFSPQYFAPASLEQRLFSYSEANAEASHRIQAGQAARARPFISAPLPTVTSGQTEVELGELIRFWVNPSEYFLYHRLDVDLGEDEACLSAYEPFELDHLERYLVKQELLFGKLGFHPAGSPAAFAARGTLPPGSIGELQLRSLDGEADRFARTVQSHLAGNEQKQTRDVKLLLPEFTLSGRLNSLYDGRVLHFRCAKLKPKDQLRAWIDHLVFCAGSDAASGATQLIAADAIVSFRPVADAAEQLARLCQGMLEGQTRPLPFFLASAFAYAAAELDEHPSPLAAARQQWHDGYQTDGEKRNESIACCFPSGDPLDDEFIALARSICRPLLAHAETTRLS